MSSKLRNAYEEAAIKIKSWEKEFFRTNMKEPLSSGMNKNILQVHKNMTNSKSLIKAWNLQIFLQIIFDLL